MPPKSAKAPARTPALRSEASLEIGASSEIGDSLSRSASFRTTLGSIPTDEYELGEGSSDGVRTNTSVYMDEIRGLREELRDLRAKTAPQPEVTPRPSKSAMSVNERNNHVLCKELLRLIPLYDGNGGIQALSVYIIRLDSYFAVAKPAQNTRLTLAIAKLKDDAHMWWQQHLRLVPEGSPNRISTWANLQKGLRETFISSENDNELRNQLFDLKQTGSVMEYNTAFRHISLQLSYITFKEVKYFYERGLHWQLKNRLRTLLGAKPATNLDELQRICLSIEGPRGTKRSHEDVPTATLPTSSRPLDSSMRGRGDHHRDARNSDRPKPNSTTVKCWLCDEPGHIYQRCPNVRKVAEVYKNSLSK